MRNQYLREIKEQNSWAYIAVDHNNKIIDYNNKAASYFPNIKYEELLFDILPQFQLKWLSDKVNKRIIRTHSEDRLMLEFISKDTQCKKMLFNDIFEFKNVSNLWCEIGQTPINLQPFIECYDDAVLITNGKGIIRAFNNKFIQLSGLNEDIINKSIYSLEEEGAIPHCAIVDVIESRESHNSLIKFSNGIEAIITSTPLYDKNKNLIRITSTIRNVTKINGLYQRLSSEKCQNKREFFSKVKLREAIDKLNLGTYKSERMREVFNVIENILGYNLPLLITGESGTGKTTMAKCIYFGRLKSEGEFIHVNCSAIPESLMESELFGYEKGSFTGAEKLKKGLFEAAENGVILLDEIGEMQLGLQAKILNVIQEKKFYRVGGTKPVEINAQVIAATNQDLKKLVEKGLFRKDLYFRLNVIPLNIPPLRDRKEDIPLLIEQVLKEMNAKYNTRKSIDTKAMGILVAYDWPGNIREVRNLVERMILLSKYDLITVNDLQADITHHVKINSIDEIKQEYAGDENSILQLEDGKTLKNMITELENKIIDRAIEKYGSVKKASMALGIDESTITRKRRKNEILKREYS
ncbi:sigma-54 interaction domain-containing protein [Desulfosporosinus fructosivorans]|nr:sigma 54-interacting transcriptional regulator [Desulfosporosinus fructosivorans]